MILRDLGYTGDWGLEDAELAHLAAAAKLQKGSSLAQQIQTKRLHFRIYRKALKSNAVASEFRLASLQIKTSYS